jgi:hypothetical protein
MLVDLRSQGWESTEYRGSADFFHKKQNGKCFRPCGMHGWLLATAEAATDAHAQLSWAVCQWDFIYGDRRLLGLFWDMVQPCVWSCIESLPSAAEILPSGMQGGQLLPAGAPAAGEGAGERSTHLQPTPEGLLRSI